LAVGISRGVLWKGKAEADRWQSLLTQGGAKNCQVPWEQTINPTWWIILLASASEMLIPCLLSECTPARSSQTVGLASGESSIRIAQGDTSVQWANWSHRENAYSCAVESPVEWSANLEVGYVWFAAKGRN
jgi:hypothetical protein